MVSDPTVVRQGTQLIRKPQATCVLCFVKRASLVRTAPHLLEEPTRRACASPLPCESETQRNGCVQWPTAMGSPAPGSDSRQDTQTHRQAGGHCPLCAADWAEPAGRGDRGWAGGEVRVRGPWQGVLPKHQVVVIDSHFLLSWKSKVRSGLGGPGVCESEGGRHKQGHGPCSVPFRTTEQGSVGAPARPGALQPR